MITTYQLMLDRKENRHPYLAKEDSHNYADECFTNPKQVVDMLNSCFHMDSLAEERIFMLVLDTAGHPLGLFELSRGTVNASLAGVRELFIRVLLCGGVSFALAHNHPSGCTEPSKEDLQVCKKVKKAASLMEITMVDFIIIGDGTYLSFCNEGFI